MPLNEADTRAKLIDPKLKAAGWGESQIEREHYFLRGKAFTAGRIYLVGEESRRRQPRRADYLLRLYNALPIAILEAKDESHTADAGLEQAKAYPLTLGVPFAYSSSGLCPSTLLRTGFDGLSTNDLMFPMNRDPFPVRPEPVEGRVTARGEAGEVKFRSL
jgi:type I site-specific restriction endonuclease